jgi:hypothetical protein
MLKRIGKLTIAVLLVILISIVNTIKGGIIVECGYNTQYWLTEVTSLLLSFGLLYYLLCIKHTQCTTIVNENVKK